MGRPPSRLRRIEYDYLVHMQGGEFCKICGFKTAKPYSLHIDHIDNNEDNNHPSNKRLLCDNDNGIKELERRKKIRDGVGAEGEGRRNCESASDQKQASEPMPETVVVKASAPVALQSAAVMDREDRKESRSSAEAKNEENQSFIENIVKTEYNRMTPTIGLIYPRCVPEMVRRCREEKGSGSDAAVKRYIKAFTSDGSNWWINPDTKQIEPRPYNEENASSEAIAKSQFERAEYYKQRAFTAEAELESTKRQVQSVLPNTETDKKGSLT